MSARLDRFFNIAASQIGYFVKPGGVTKFGIWYGLPTGQWCAMYVSWVAEQSGNADIIPKNAYTPSGAQWFRDRDQWHDGIEGIQRGDIAYFDFPGAPNRISHVGPVESVNADGSVNTIEGNTSGPAGDQRNGGACLRKTRKSWIVGYGRPNWGTTAPPTEVRNYLQKGDTGPEVKDMQSRLIRLGYSVGAAGADSSFGDGTRAGLIKFQEDNHLEPDGYYGPISKSVLVGQTNAPVDTRPKNADGSLRLETDGSRGPAHIGRWQEVMGTPIDWKISKPESSLIKADQRFLNSVVAAEHIRNLDPNQRRRRSSLLEDGDEGPFTIVVRQFWLRNAMNPIHQHNLIGKLLDFDQLLGPDTNRVHQFALNQATSGSGRYGQV